MRKKVEHVIDRGDLRKYRTELPNMIDDADLSLYAYRLYGHLKRRAGDTGYCNEGARKMAAHCKMSPASVVNAKKELEAKGLIEITPGDPKTSTPDTIYIVDIWAENFTEYAKHKDAPRSLGEHPPVHMVNTPVHETHAPCSPYEHPVHVVAHKKEPREEITREQEITNTEGASRSRATAPARKSNLIDDEFLAELGADPTYTGINIARELGKMSNWCKARNKSPTRRRFINWLNNADPEPTTAPERNGNGKYQPHHHPHPSNADKLKRQLERFGVDIAPKHSGPDSSGLS